MTRQTIQYVPMTNGVALIYKDDNTKTSEVLGDIPKTNIAARLVACWNACREFDDPAKGVAALQEDNANGLRELRKSQEHAQVLQDQLRVNKLAYDALRDWATGKTLVCPDLRQTDKPCDRPEVNVQDGAHESFMRFTIIGPGVDATGYVTGGQVNKLSDLVEDALEVLADLAELWKRNRDKGRSAPGIRGAMLLTVADINRLTTGCQTK